MELATDLVGKLVKTVENKKLWRVRAVFLRDGNPWLVLSGKNDEKMTMERATEVAYCD